MKFRALFLSLLFVLFGAGLADAAKVRSWHDPQYDFGEVKTYRWKTESGPAGQEYVDRRIRNEVDAVLAKKGLRKLPAGDEPADVLVLYFVGSADTLVAGLDVKAGWYGGLVAVPGTASSLSAGIVIELLDVESGKEVWAASYIMKGNTPGSMQMMIDDAEKAVRGALKKYPPK